MSDKILIIEDNDDINNMIHDSLTMAGYTCLQAFSGTEGLLLAKTEKPNLVILDLMLPGKNGEQVLPEIKKCMDIPIIVISAKDGIDTKIELLKAGAEDYMTKPLNLKELEARVFVQIRRFRNRTGETLQGGQTSGTGEMLQGSQTSGTGETLQGSQTSGTGEMLQGARASVVRQDSQNRCTQGRNAEDSLSVIYGELELNSDKHYLRVNGRDCDLTKHEFNILELLMKNPDKAFTKQAIYDFAWDDSYLGEDKTVNVHIGNIRKKLKAFTDREYIETVWGIGFKIKK